MEQRKRKLDLKGQDKDPDDLKRSIQSGINPYTGREYSSRYYDILSGRQGMCLVIEDKTVYMLLKYSKINDMCRIACLAS